MLQRVYDAFSDSLYDYTCKLLKEEQAAEDMVVESMLKVWENREKMKSIEHVRNFLLTVAHNSCLDMIAREKKKSKAEIYFSELNRDDRTDLAIAEGELTYAKVVHVIKEQMEDLPLKQKEILELWHHEQKSVQEISNEMGVAASTVYNQMRASFRKIRKQVETALQR